MPKTVIRIHTRARMCVCYCSESAGPTDLPALLWEMTCFDYSLNCDYMGAALENGKVFLSLGLFLFYSTKDLTPGPKRLPVPTLLSSFKRCG